MAYFHSQYPKSPAGKPKWKVVGDKVEEILRLGREYPEVKTIVPDRRNTKMTAKNQAIYALVPYDRQDILGSIESTAVSDLHVSVMSMILREENWGLRFGHTESSRKYFDREIRGKTIQLLSRGSWVDEPSSLGLKNWNMRLENLDLGRRSDLKFSSIQSDKLKYDQDLRKDRVKNESTRVEGNWTEFGTDELISFMRNAPAETVQEIWITKPWLHGRFAEAGLQEP